MLVMSELLQALRRRIADWFMYQGVKVCETHEGVIYHFEPADQSLYEVEMCRRCGEFGRRVVVMSLEDEAR